MSWKRRGWRRAAIKSVLAHAEARPEHGLPYEYLPEVRQVFATRRDLVLALQYDWSQALWARIELLSRDSGGRQIRTDASVLPQAWSERAESHPVLRRLLDELETEVVTNVA